MRYNIHQVGGKGRRHALVTQHDKRVQYTHVLMIACVCGGALKRRANFFAKANICPDSRINEIVDVWRAISTRMPTHLTGGESVVPPGGHERKPFRPRHLGGVEKLAAERRVAKNLSLPSHDAAKAKIGDFFCEMQQGGKTRHFPFK